MLHRVDPVALHGDDDPLWLTVVDALPHSAAGFSALTHHRGSVMKTKVLVQLRGGTGADVRPVERSRKAPLEVRKFEAEQQRVRDLMDSRLADQAESESLMMRRHYQIRPDTAFSSK